MENIKILTANSPEVLEYEINTFKETTKLYNRNTFNVRHYQVIDIKVIIKDKYYAIIKYNDNFHDIEYNFFENYKPVIINNKINFELKSLNKKYLFEESFDEIRIHKDIMITNNNGFYDVYNKKGEKILNDSYTSYLIPIIGAWNATEFTLLSSDVKAILLDGLGNIIYEGDTIKNINGDFIVKKSTKYFIGTILKSKTDEYDDIKSVLYSNKYLAGNNGVYNIITSSGQILSDDFIILNEFVNHYKLVKYKKGDYGLISYNDEKYRFSRYKLSKDQKSIRIGWFYRKIKL